MTAMNAAQDRASSPDHGSGSPLTWEDVEDTVMRAWSEPDISVKVKRGGGGGHADR
ncbi:hypothetical protein GCM10010339_54720 [Streptomyces alanosinicus]|uniref:Uncharacterized protein n=1 Tax=Streptomyces alanosinicus TaxID=68171 RepID=A0A919D4M4_9ACTN|nr:hypothetical protein GCM10010339_54720 [Streptomyces alanosinicus]